MRGANHYKPSSFSLGDTYNERTSHFIGVDLTSPSTQVNLARGVFSRNYVARSNGKAQTRFAYECVFNTVLYATALSASAQITATYVEGLQVKIAGIWEFPTSSGNRLIIAYKDANGHIFLGEGTLGGGVFGESSVNPALNVTVLYYGTVSASNKKKAPFAVFANEKLWVLTGGDFVVVYLNDNSTFGASPVSSWSGAHVPIVTYMGVASNALNVPSSTFVTLEYPNLLSRFRRDLFLGGLGKPEDDYSGYTFLLSSSTDFLDFARNIKVTVERLKPNNTTEKLVFRAVMKVTIVDNGSQDIHTPVNGVVYNFPNGTAQEEAAFILEHFGEYAVRGTTSWVLITELKKNQIGNEPYFSNITEYGVLVNNYDPLNSGRKFGVSMANDYTPIVQGKPNIEFRYPMVSEADFATQIQFIAECTFGALFGKNNSLNRLWLAGNPNKPNYAIHSAESYKGLDEGNIIADESDFTYFPDEGMIKFGEASNAIVGMVPLSPDKMMILKNRFGNERTMFFVTPFDVTETIISAGTYGETVKYTTSDVSIVREQYSTSMSNTSTSGYSQETVDNFNGETLFLSSEKQIVGLDIEGITGDSQRVANTRSHYIDGAICDEDLEGSELFHSGNYLYFVTKSTAYVTRFDSLSADTKQFEWWPCDTLESNMLSKCVLMDGTVLIIGLDGRINRLNYQEDENHEIADLYRTHVVTGQAVIDGSTGLITISSDLVTSPEQLEENETIGGRLLLPEESDASIVDDTLYRFVPNETTTKLYETMTVECLCRGYDWYFPVTNAYLLHCFATKSIPSATPASNPRLTFEEVSVADLPEGVADLVPAAFAWYKATRSDTSSRQEVISLQLHMPINSENLYVFHHSESTYRLYREFDGVLYKVENLNTYVSAGNTVFVGCFERKKRIEPIFISIRLTQGKIGYDKIIDNFTVWNDSNVPSELYIGTVKNNQREIAYRNFISEQGGAFTISELNFDLFTFVDAKFSRNPTPRFYNLRCFKHANQSFTVCFTSKTKRISVLPGIDILYRLKNATNKR